MGSINCWICEGWAEAHISVTLDDSMTSATGLYASDYGEPKMDEPVFMHCDFDDWEPVIMSRKYDDPLGFEVVR